MKGMILVGTMFLSLVLLAGACTNAGAASVVNPPDKVSPAPNKYLVSVSGVDFNTDPRITKQVEVKTGDVFTVALDSNATTGFSWTEQAGIADGNILTQTEHAYVAPQTDSDRPVAGMSGIEEWWFTAGQAGTTIVTMSYSRPWEGGEKDVRVFILTVIVK